MRLKQSVVRLKFDDTSSQAGFPARDWQLTANDPGSGGADRFSIEDLAAGTVPFTVRGGAPNSSIYVDAAGKVGLGTAVPAAGLHLSGGAAQSLRLEKTGAPARAWELAADDASFRVVDVTNAAAVPFRLAAGAPADSLTITGSGRVGIGTAAPAANLSLVGAAAFDAVMRVRNTSSTGYSGIEFIDQGGTPRFFFGVNNNNATTRLNSFSTTPFLMLTDSVERIRIEPGGNVSLGCTGPTSRLVLGGFGTSCGTAPYSSINPGSSTFTTSSSRSYKENLRQIEVPDILQRIEDVVVYSYDFIGGPKDRLGLVSEEFHRVFERGSDKMIEGGEIEMALWLAVQHLSRRNQELEARNEEVEKRLAELEALVREQMELQGRLRRWEARRDESRGDTQ